MDRPSHCLTLVNWDFFIAVRTSNIRSCGLRNILMCCNFVIKYGQRNDIYWSLSRLTYLVISILHKTYLLNYKSCSIYFKIDFEIYKIGNMSNVGPLELPHPGLVEVMWCAGWGDVLVEVMWCDGWGDVMCWLRWCDGWGDVMCWLR